MKFENGVTFETKCYENDWEYILKGNYLKEMIQNCNYDFKYKNLIINNVKNKGKVLKYVKILKDKNIITDYYFVDDFVDKVLEKFELTKESLGKGYYYSIAELTGIYLCKTKYLLHFSSDSFIKKTNSSKWITETIDLFEKNDNYITANPIWNNKIEEVRKEEIEFLNDSFSKAFGFSDQCYLAKTEIFNGNIYNEKNIFSERYPKYGGELFEKRVDSYMRNHNLYRLNYLCLSYTHKNFPKNKYKKKILLIIQKLFRNEFSTIFRN